MNCPMCSTRNSKVSYCWMDFAVLECLSCGFRFIDSSAPGYPVDAQYVYDEAEIGLIRPELPHIQRRVRDILRFKEPPGRTLDIGCGKGEVALALQQAGFKATGVDIKSRIMAHLQKKHPEVDWRNSSTDQLPVLTENFDVLTLYHVLEHVSGPRDVLASVKILANPGALVVIEVPNVAGLKARLQGEKWNYFKVDHVNYFRKIDLIRLAEMLDFDILHVCGYQHFSYPQNNLIKDCIKKTLAFMGFQDVISIFCRVR